MPPPTISNQSISTEIQKKKSRYSKSQYLELPSLNTRKQYLDINDTSIHSYRELKH